MTMSPITIVWIRRDLRLNDNPALFSAAERGKVIITYILDQTSPSSEKTGAASQWWLHHALASLRDDLMKKGVSLMFRKGDPLIILHDMIKETGATHVSWNRCYTPHDIARDTQIKSALSAIGVSVDSFNAGLLFEPWSVRTKTNGYYKVYTPFSKACFSTPVQSPLPVPPTIDAMTAQSLSLEDLGLLPRGVDWAAGFRDTWLTEGPLSEERIHHDWHNFLHKKVNDYKEMRDRPDQDGTSCLSAAIHFGQISPRTLWYDTERHQSLHPEASTGAHTFLKELIWREFSYHLLFHCPTLPHAPFNSKFADFSWSYSLEAFQRWCQGKTGYPIVDAGMRQLWQTGWMHNRVRMVVASFLTKHLLISWQKGEEWFRDCLVDADLASNAASWQWVAGCGADAAPYFRVFNPILQGKKFDPRGDYIRRYVPELEQVPTESIHAPWEADSKTLARAGVILGTTYPKPIVDHGVARTRALTAYARMADTIS